MVNITPRDVMLPSEEILRAATETKSVTDSLGRSLTVGRLTIQRRRTRAKLVPAELQSSPDFMALATPAMCVQAIDGTPVPLPQSFLQLEALIDRLDVPGCEAVLATLITLDHDPLPSGDALKNG